MARGSGRERFGRRKATFEERSGLGERVGSSG